MADPICLCGHYKSIHEFAMYSVSSFCTECYKCKEYKLDNLRYLEGAARDKENDRHNKASRS